MRPNTETAVPELLRREQLLRHLPFSRATLDRMVRAGDFPAPVRLGQRIVAWRADEVAAWIEAREDRDPGRLA